MSGAQLLRSSLRTNGGEDGLDPNVLWTRLVAIPDVVLDLPAAPPTCEKQYVFECIGRSRLIAGDGAAERSHLKCLAFENRRPGRGDSHRAHAGEHGLKPPAYGGSSAHRGLVRRH